MDKMEIAVQVLLKLIETDKTGFDAEGIAAYSWEITDAMQAEAKKREQEASEKASKEIKDILENHEHVFVDGRICWCGKIKSDKAYTEAKPLN